MKEKFKTKPIAITLIFVLMFQYFSVILSLLESNANSYTDSVTGITWEYELNSDGEAINVKPSGTLTGEIVVPNTIDGHSVTGIAESAFYGKNNITKITLPGTVETIGESAFKNCSSLSEINLPEGITMIADYMFYNCRKYWN